MTVHLEAIYIELDETLPRHFVKTSGKTILICDNYSCCQELLSSCANRTPPKYFWSFPLGLVR